MAWPFPETSPGSAWFPKEESSRIAGERSLQAADAVSVVQPTVSELWRKIHRKDKIQLPETEVSFTFALDTHEDVAEYCLHYFFSIFPTVYGE